MPARGRLFFLIEQQGVLHVGSHNGQIGMGQQAEGDVAMPGGPVPHFVLIQPHLSFRLGESFLDGPTCTSHAHGFVNLK